MGHNAARTVARCRSGGAEHLPFDYASGCPVDGSPGEMACGTGKTGVRVQSVPIATQRYRRAVSIGRVFRPRCSAARLAHRIARYRPAELAGAPTRIRESLRSDSD